MAGGRGRPSTPNCSRRLPGGSSTWPWPSAAGIDLPVSVNVAARSLLDPSFPAQVAEALRLHRLPASSLVLEITESVAVSEQDIVDDVRGELRESGSSCRWTTSATATRRCRSSPGYRPTTAEDRRRSPPVVRAGA
jgi:hypothetical protein